MNLKELHERAEAEKAAKEGGKDPSIAKLQYDVNQLTAKVNALVLNVEDTENKLRIYQKKIDMLLKKMMRGHKILQADLTDISQSQQSMMKKK